MMMIGDKVLVLFFLFFLFFGYFTARDMTSSPPVASGSAWRSIASDYAKVAGSAGKGPMWGGIALRALALQPGEVFLDDACGPGVHAVQAAQLGASVDATDFAESMVDLTKAAYQVAVSTAAEAAATATTLASSPAPPLGPLRAHVMNGEELQFPDDTFDAALSSLGVTLFSDWRKGFHELHRVVKSGTGRVAVATWAETSNSPSRFYEETARTVYGFSGEFAVTDGLGATQNEDKLRSVMEEAGFKDVTVERVVDTMSMQVRDYVTMSTSNPVVRAMSERVTDGKVTHEAFMESVRTLLTAEFEDGLVSFPVHMLVALGRKG